jgi:FkbM family methyltransferase
MVVYDIGANTGIYTVLACRSVGANGRVFAFEPATMNLFYLHENIRANRFINCEVISKAVSNSDGSQAMSQSASLSAQALTQIKLHKSPLLCKESEHQQGTSCARLLLGR